MPRPTRKRYGNDGGGFPLGQILALSLGGGEANPEFDTAQAAQAGGQEGPPTRGQEKALKTGPNKPSNIFQKFYGMDEGDKENRAYRLGQIEAQDTLRRQIAAIPQLSAAKTAAEIASGRAVQRAGAEDMASTIPVLSQMGALPETPGAGPLNDQGTADLLMRLYAKGGMIPTLTGGTADLLKLRGDTAMLPRAGEEATAGQGAKIAKSRLESTAAEQERGTREKYPGEVEKGIRGEFLRPAYPQVGGVMFDITDPRYSFTATPEQRGGGVDLAGNVIPSLPPGFIVQTPEGVSGPGAARPKVAAQAPPAATGAAAGTKPAALSSPLRPSYSAFNTSVNAPSLSAQAITPEAQAATEAERKLRQQAEAEAAKKRLRELFPYGGF